MTYSKEQLELLRAVSEYYEFPFEVFFMPVKQFKEDTVKRTRMEEVEADMDALYKIQDIIYDLKEREI